MEKKSVKITELCVTSFNEYIYFQFGRECYCGDSIPQEYNKTTVGDCSMSCIGDNSEKCGGYWKISVYETGRRTFFNYSPRNVIFDTNN